MTPKKRTRGQLIVLSGPSGVGKSTVIAELLSERENIYFSVSFTTRAPRVGEADGVHYHFVTRERFEAMIDGDELLEYAEYVHNYYGTSLRLIREKLDGRIAMKQGTLTAGMEFTDEKKVWIWEGDIFGGNRKSRRKRRKTEFELQVMQSFDAYYAQALEAEKGLEPLAEAIFAQTRGMAAPDVLAQDYLDAEKGVETVADALQGANDIIAEWISDDAAIRKSLRELLEKRGTLRSLAATEEDSVYRLYYDFSQPIAKLQGHQILAINRGEKEEKLKATVLLDRDLALPLLRRAVVKPGSTAMEFVKAAAEDAYDRLIYPSLEREMRAALTDRASEGAIQMFALNLKPLLMQPPVKGFVTMGLDPGYSHGCKVAVVDATGKVLDTTVVYPTFGERQKREAIAKLAALIRKHHVAHLAIGNGTASRETEAMAVELIREVGGVSYMIVNEAGASVYSASKLAAEEFPQYDVNLRSAVSIARRLQDPLAELVKIDPKAIGVGQYQHDIDQKKLTHALDGVVEDCVNHVGVDLNTASVSLLSHVAGVTPQLAKNIVAYRDEAGGSYFMVFADLMHDFFGKIFANDNRLCSI